MSCVPRMNSKFDSEKAYDHFNWEVLVYLLGRMGLLIIGDYGYTLAY